MSEPTMFVDDDDGYRRWIYAHPSRFVINTLRGGSGGQPILHSAICDHVAPRAEAHWTTGDYVKICGDKRIALDLWAREQYGAFPTPCRNCEP